MPTRRNVLELLTIGAATASLGGCGGNAPDPAAAWRSPGAGERDLRMWGLAHAILAPNPHNRQPWQVALRDSDQILLYVDPAKRLPATDPFDRQTVVGCGAFLELLSLALREAGKAVEITPWPEGAPGLRLDERPVARVRLRPEPNPRRDPLFAQITRRHTNRQPFGPEAPSVAATAGITAAASGEGLKAQVVTDPGRRARLIDLGWRGYQVESGTPRTNMESVRLMRFGAAQIARSPDGIALQGPMIEALRLAGLMSPAAMADPGSLATRSANDMLQGALRATPAFFVLQTAGADRTMQLAAGRAYVRAQLAATEAGLAMQPWSMTLQEFPEMAKLYAATQRELGASPEAPVQMLVRLGTAKPVEPSPRWPLSTHIVPDRAA